jgi:hypothetical protein
MPTKIEKELTEAQKTEFCARLYALTGKDRELAGIQRLAADYGITISHMSASRFRDGPYRRYLEKLERGRDTADALVAAVRGGSHPLDAIEEATVLELQDHLTSGEKIDIEWVVKQLVKLRTSISMRDESRRKQADLERRLAESEKKIEIANAQLRLANERSEKHERERLVWEETRAKAKAALEAASAPAARKGITAETLRKAQEALKLL